MLGSSAKAFKVGEGGQSRQTQVDQGTTPTTRRPRLLSFIQGLTLRFFFASGDSEETRVLNVSREEDKGRGCV